MPAWIVVAVGALVASLEPRPARLDPAPRVPEVRTVAVPGRAAPAAWPARFVHDPDRRELGRMCPRELRGLPGLGQVRAVEVARAGWLHGPGFARLEDVPGIGEVTARRVEEWLEDGR